MGEERKVAAILVADVVGYSRLTGADEEATLARLRALRSELFNPAVAAHGGRVVKRLGDGVIVEFRSVVEAVRCAIEVTKGLAERNAALPPDRRIEVRTGIHLGDVVEEPDGDLLGDGVNIAARIEGICQPGGVCLSEDAWRQVRDKLPEPFVDLGEQRLKNIARPMRAYALADGSPGRRADPPAAPPLPAPALHGDWPARVEEIVREARQHRATYRALRRKVRGHGEPERIRTAADGGQDLATDRGAGRPVHALIGAAVGVLDGVGRLIGALADKTAAHAPPAPIPGGAPSLDDQRRRRRLRRAIIAAAILTVLGARACSERQSFLPPPPPAPPRLGAAEGAAVARVATVLFGPSEGSRPRVGS